MLQFLGTGFAAYLKIQAVWEKGRTIPDCDAQVWRLDADGYLIKRCEYGSAESQYGWRIDHHPTPEALGGSNEVANLRPLSCTGQTAHAGLLEGALGVRTAFGRAA